jgi:hypothetical protein
MILNSERTRGWARAAALAFALALAGCGGASVTPNTPPTGEQQANRAPSITGASSVSVQAGSALQYRPTASDPDGQSLTFRVSSLPGWASFSAANGSLSGTPSAANVGTYTVTIYASDGSLESALAVTINVTPAAGAPPPGTGTPTISGPAAATALVGSAFSYRPTASDPDGQTLTFRASGLPSWASFNSANGTISGTPTATSVGTSNVTITVSDGTLEASLTLALTVTQTTTGRATLSWSPPTQRTDGSALTNLAGYRIYYGTSASSLGSRIDVPTAGTTSWVVENLTPGTWYFAATAVDGDGNESALSVVASKTIG